MAARDYEIRRWVCGSCLAIYYAPFADYTECPVCGGWEGCECESCQRLADHLEAGEYKESEKYLHPGKRIVSWSASEGAIIEPEPLPF
ncbi:MAG: hypothetical protein JXJ17_04415 [Anaerolineae bacterium]|nr:hypothetical protein [Anaerolineae bacterium]